jgi:hypothetical protein
MAPVELNETRGESAGDGDRGSKLRPDEQPIQRVVGTRTPPPPGTLPNAAVRAAMTANARYLTRVPKGIYLYDSPEQMNRDRERWTVELMVARQLERGLRHGTHKRGGGLI